MSFNHKYELIVSETNESGLNQALLIDQLQVEFDISKDTSSKMNESTIRVFNLSESSRNLIKSYEKNNGFVKLSAGYEDTGISQLFVGNIIRLTSYKQGTDIVTEITCSDGYASVKDSITNRRFPEKVSLRTIITTIGSEDMGLSIGELIGKNLDKTYERGVTVEGNSYNHIKKVATEHKLELSIQNNTLTVIPTQGTSQRSAINLSPATGIIGSPQFEGQKAGETTDTKNPKSGIKLNHILIPAVFPGRIINVESKFASGSYKVEKVGHKGSFRGDEWQTSIEGVIVSTEQEEEL